MEDDSALPSALSVLDKLKSEGSFDRFRRACLADIEEEPSFRAQKEHVEVLTRRFLQRFDVKEGKTKNEIRAKLRNFVTDEIRKPDVQVSQPIDKLIQSTLESKAPQLFQKILEIIDMMQQPAPPPPLPPDYPPNDKQYKPPPPEPSSLNNTNNRVQGHEEITRPSTLEMPLDLLELSTFSNPVNVRKGIKVNKMKTEKPIKGTKQHESMEGKESNEKETIDTSSNAQYISINDTVDKSIGDGHVEKSVVSDGLVDDTALKMDSISEGDEVESEGEGGDLTVSSCMEEGGSPPKATPTNVRRSARLASIEEDKKEVVSVDTISTTRQSEPRAEVEQISDDAMEINEDALSREVIDKPKSRLVSRTRKRPTVFSSSSLDSDSDNDQGSRKKGIKEEEKGRRKQHTSRVRRLTQSSMSSPLRDSLSPEEVKVKRSRKRKKL